MTASPSVLFRCDGSAKIGLGHVVRCLALADELHEAHGCRIAFAMRDGPLGFEMVSKKGYPVLNPPEADRLFDYRGWLSETIRGLDCQVLIADVRDDLSRSDVENLRKEGTLIVVIDDGSERRLAADLAFYPPVPQVRRLNWDGFTGKLFVGWEWILLRREFSQCQPRIPNKRPVVLVTMGGSDPKGLTLKAVAALDLLQEDFHCLVLLGPGFAHCDALKDLLATAQRRFDVRHSATDISSLMARADLAVASFGVTAYELAAMGVPAVYLCLTDDHAESASAFGEVNIAKSLGEYSQVSATTLKDAVQSLLVDNELRAEMSAYGRTLVDGCGSKRVANQIVMTLTQ